MWMVEGGVFKNTEFKELAGPKETYGPFTSYDQAKKAWWEGACKQVDICEHRLFIKEA